MCVMWRVHGTTHQVDMINVCGPQVCRPAVGRGVWSASAMSC